MGAIWRSTAKFSRPGGFRGLPGDHPWGYCPNPRPVERRGRCSKLAKLPTDRQIVVYCYTGQTASQVTSALRLLGYDAYNMLYGMQTWTMDDEVRVNYWQPEKHSFGYPYVGTAPGATVDEGAMEEVVAEETTVEETTTTTEETSAETAEPETMPETGGLAFPVESALVAFGTLTAAAGLYLRRREAA